LKQLVETKSTEIFEGSERICQPFYNGRIGITLVDFVVDAAFDQSPIGSPIDQTSSPGSVEERSSEQMPRRFIQAGMSRGTKRGFDQLHHCQSSRSRQQLPPVYFHLALPRFGGLAVI